MFAIKHDHNGSKPNMVAPAFPVTSFMPFHAGRYSSVFPCHIVVSLVVAVAVAVAAVAVAVAVAVVVVVAAVVVTVAVIIITVVVVIVAWFGCGLGPLTLLLLGSMAILQVRKRGNEAEQT